VNWSYVSISIKIGIRNGTFSIFLTLMFILVLMLISKFEPALRRWVRDNALHQQMAECPVSRVAIWAALSVFSVSVGVFYSTDVLKIIQGQCLEVHGQCLEGFLLRESRKICIVGVVFLNWEIPVLF